MPLQTVTSKYVKLTNTVAGAELIKAWRWLARVPCMTAMQLLADKFNLGDVDLSEFAVFDVRDTQGT